MGSGSRTVRRSLGALGRQGAPPPQRAHLEAAAAPRSPRPGPALPCPARLARPRRASEPVPGWGLPLPGACLGARPGGEPSRAAPRRSQLGAGSPAPVRGALRRGGTSGARAGWAGGGRRRRPGERRLWRR